VAIQNRQTNRENRQTGRTLLGFGLVIGVKK